MAGQGKTQESNKSKSTAKKDAKDAAPQWEAAELQEDGDALFVRNPKQAPIDSLAGRLGDRRLPAIQRQAIAGMVGRTLGNAFLQRAVARARESQAGQEAPVTTGQAEPSDAGGQTSAAYDSLSEGLLSAIRSRDELAIGDVLNEVMRREDLREGERERLRITAISAREAIVAAEAGDTKGILNALAKAQMAGVSKPANLALNDLISFLLIKISRQELAQALSAKDPRAILQALSLAQMGGVPEKVHDEIESQSLDGLGAIGLEKVAAATEARDIKGVLEALEYAQLGLAKEEVAEEIEAKAYEGQEIIHREKMAEAIEAGDAPTIMKLAKNIRMGLVQGEAAEALLAQAAAALRKLGRDEMADVVEGTSEPSPEEEAKPESRITPPRRDQADKPRKRRQRKKKAAKSEPSTKTKTKEAFIPRLLLVYNRNKGQGSLWLNERLYVSFRVSQERPMGVETQPILLHINPEVKHDYDARKQRLRIHLMLPPKTKFQAETLYPDLIDDKLMVLELGITVGAQLVLRQSSTIEKAGPL